MTTVYIDCTKDAWYVLYNASNRYGNGAGPRLQSGYSVDGSSNTWQHRIGLAFYENGVIPAGATIVSATARGTVRGTHSCFAQGSSPAMYFERPLDADAVVAENTTSDECAVTGSGGDNTYAATESGGILETTTTNRASWSGTPSTGDVISVDVTDMFVAWLAAKTTGDYFCLVGKAQTEGVQNQKIAFDSYDIAGSCIHSGGTAWDLVVVYTLNNKPVVNNTNRSPADGARQTGTTSRTFSCDFSDADSADQTAGPTPVQIQIDDTSSAFASLVVDNTAAPDSYSNPTWSRTLTVSETRGATYYWRYRVNDGTEWSDWSTAYTYDVNQLPTASLTSPT